VLRRIGGVAGIATALAAFLFAAGGVTAGSGAARPSAALTVRSSDQAVARYLRSIGVDPKGVVVQRGKRNYAGPRCPGKRWNCTRATRVVQVAATHGTNTFVCSPASTGTDPSTSTCVIVQLAVSGQNVATCDLQRFDAPASISQTCLIYQKNALGKKTNKNIAVVTQVAEQQGAGGLQETTQTARVKQTNDAGPNNLNLQQEVIQSLSTSAATVGQEQRSTQEYEIAQCGLLTGVDDTCDFESPVAMSGSASSVASQSLTQRASAPNATTGSQTQIGTARGEVDQWTTSNATSSNTQEKSQSESALGPDVIQTQIDPGLCCSRQGTNPSDRFTIDQTVTQSKTLTNAPAFAALSAPTASFGSASGPQSSPQFNAVFTNCQTSGTCNAAVRLTQQGVTTLQSFSGPSVGNAVVCGVNGACQAQAGTATVPTALAFPDDPILTGGSPATLSVTLTPAQSPPDAGRETVLISAGGETCQATTGSPDPVTGAAVASCSLNLAPGAYVATAFYPGHPVTSASDPKSPGLQPSAASTHVIVFSVLDQGAFAISDLKAAVGNDVTFWSSQWSQANPFSAAPSAPNEMKGFAAALSAPLPTCSATFTTDTGNSPPPPDTLPGDIVAVAVVSGVTKSGSTLSGSIVGTAVVDTNPGYSPAPGGAGTGKVLAVLPC